MGDHSEIDSGKPAEQKQSIHASQTAAHKTLPAPKSPFSLCNVMDREREGGSGIAHAIKTEIPAVSFHVGNILRAFSKLLWPSEIAAIVLVKAVYFQTHSAPIVDYIVIMT
jgi:hypothetical protein